MTTDKKQPPDTDRHTFIVFREVLDDGPDEAMTKARDLVVSARGSMAFVGSGEHVTTHNNEGLRVYRRYEAALAILDRYDEERAEWERRVKEARAGTDGLRSSGYVLETRVGELNCEIDALRSQVTALTEERDRLKTLTDELDITTAGRWRALAIEERARADRAEKERDEARAEAERTREAADTALKSRDAMIDERNRAQHKYDEAYREYQAELQREKDHMRKQVDAVVDRARDERVACEVRIDEARRERDRAIAERDDLGCQLEALRAIQRGDVADLRMRVEAVEKNESDVDERVCQLEAYRAVILETMKQMASSPDAYNEAERRARKVIYGDGNNVHRRSFAKELKSSVDPRDAKEARDRWSSAAPLDAPPKNEVR